MELRNSVEALNLQSQELRESVEQQKALVEVTKAQAEAELAALKDERRARRDAISPRFSLSAKSGSKTGNKLRHRIEILNIGANCSDVELRTFGAFENFRHSVALMESAGSILTHLDSEAGNTPPSFFFLISSKNIRGESARQIFHLKHQVIDQAGFSVSDMSQKEFEQQH